MRVSACIIALCFVTGAQAQFKKGWQKKDTGLPSYTVFKSLNLPSLALQSATERALKIQLSCPVNCVALPVKWLSVKGERKTDTTCLIEWQTAKEEANIGFDVERSLGNTNYFIKIGFVPASVLSNPVLDYSMLDRNDYSGTSFYRLKQMDNNNDFEYSKTVAVKGFSKEESLAVYPNPVQNTMEVSILLSKAGSTLLMLFDAAGRVIEQRKEIFMKGSNIYQWNITALATGTYFIRAFMPSEKSVSVVFIKK